jgi:hypothetical protein
MLRLILMSALVAAPSVAAAQDGPPQRIRSVQITKGQKCPPAAPGEVVVCSTVDEPYRIPRPLRDDGPIAATGQSWVNRAATVDQVGRVAGGLPNTCSPVGTGGQSGCASAYAQQWAAERRAARGGDGSGSQGR